jgi:hypothetical protein
MLSLTDALRLIVFFVCVRRAPCCKSSRPAPMLKGSPGRSFAPPSSWASLPPAVLVWFHGAGFRDGCEHRP